MIVVVVVRPLEAGKSLLRIFEIPKSSTFTSGLPSLRRVRKRFPGFRSRWMIPSACAAAIASQAWRT